MTWHIHSWAQTPKKRKSLVEMPAAACWLICVQASRGWPTSPARTLTSRTRTPRHAPGVGGHSLTVPNQAEPESGALPPGDVAAFV